MFCICCKTTHFLPFLGCDSNLKQWSIYTIAFYAALCLILCQLASQMSIHWVITFLFFQSLFIWSSRTLWTKQNGSKEPCNGFWTKYSAVRGRLHNLPEDSKKHSLYSLNVHHVGKQKIYINYACKLFKTWLKWHEKISSSCTSPR